MSEFPTHRIEIAPPGRVYEQLVAWAADGDSERALSRFRAAFTV